MTKTFKERNQNELQVRRSFKDKSEVLKAEEKIKNSTGTFSVKKTGGTNMTS